MPTQIAAFLLLSLATLASAAVGSEPSDSPERLVARRTLSDGRVVVVAEGDGEPRSTGSYSVRVYTGAQPEFPLDEFRVGSVFSRDGSVEKVALEDITGDGARELVIVVRSAGSGGYLSARALRIGETAIEIVASAEGMASDADPIAELREAKP